MKALLRSTANFAAKPVWALGMAVVCFVPNASAFATEATSELALDGALAQTVAQTAETAPDDVDAQEAAPEAASDEMTEAVPSSPEKIAKIEELLALTNATALSTQVMEGVIAQFSGLLPEVPEEWWDRFVEKVDDTDLNALVVPIYDRNFTEAEIDAMIAFYQTPEGQSVIAKMPMVTQDSIEIGQAWGIQLAEEVLQELEADGFEI